MTKQKTVKHSVRRGKSENMRKLNCEKARRKLLKLWILFRSNSCIKLGDKVKLKLAFRLWLSWVTAMIPLMDRKVQGFSFCFFFVSNKSSTILSIYVYVSFLAKNYLFLLIFLLVIRASNFFFFFGNISLSLYRPKRKLIHGCLWVKFIVFCVFLFTLTPRSHESLPQYLLRKMNLFAATMLLGSLTPIN